jgi:acetate---CoA ligase (ADP-forming)
VRALVVLSAGFAETGHDGAPRQQELLRVCRQAGMRLIGPNCLGVLNTDPAVRLNAQFGPSCPSAGRVGFMSQSGALGLAIIDYATSLGLGLSTFVSAGNKADLSGNDLLHYWEDDQNTDVILLYLESFGNPRKFSRIARRVARRKPIVAVKSGRTSAGAKAASSHTGALLQASDHTVDALFRQAGVVRTDTLSELFEVAALLANQPTPVGRGHDGDRDMRAPGRRTLDPDLLNTVGSQHVDRVDEPTTAVRERLVEDRDAPTPDAPTATPQSAPPPPVASDADTTTDATTHRSAPPTRPWRTAAATHAPSAAPPRSGEPHPSPSRRRR